MLHALPLYHCAQLDVFLGSGGLRGRHQRHHGRADAGQPAPADRREHRITSFFAPPTVWISPAALAAVRPERPVQRCEKGYYGASIMPVEVLREIQRAPARGAAVEPVRPDRDRAAGDRARPRGPAAQARLLRSAGAERRDARGRRRDERRRRPARSARSCTARRSCCSGYLPRRRTTAAAFEGGWFHSGDLATVDDEGYITVVDRKKDMIKTGGENVASREVEEAIYRLPQVSEVAVIGLPRPAVDRGGVGGRGGQAGPDADAAAVVDALPRPPGRLQGAEARDLCRSAAEEPERQDAEAANCGSNTNRREAARAEQTFGVLPRPVTDRAGRAW